MTSPRATTDVPPGTERVRGSVRSRIVWTTALVTIGAMALMTLVVVVVVARLTTGRIDASLEDRAAATEATLERRPDGTLRVVRTDDEAVIDSVWVYDPDGTEVAGPRAGQRVQATVDRLGTVTRTTRLQRRDRVYYAVPVRLTGEARPSGVVVASESVEPYEGSTRLLIGGLVGLGVLVTAISAALTAWTVTRTLRPVAQMTGLAGLWSERDLDSRFALGGRSNELTRLGDTLDALLDRVAAAIRNEQLLTSELAHELRTPLTSIRAEAELGMATSADESMRERLDRVVAQVDRLNATIGTLLAVARHQERATTHHCDLATVLDDLVASHPGRAPIELVAGGPVAGPQVVAADASLVERVVGPVLDNAVRHASTRVWIRTRSEARTLVVEVCDDGPGFADTESVFDAGRSYAASAGAGLGLPLARRVAATLGASLRVASASDPTVVEVRFPAR